MSEENATRLINLDIAEYQALTTRCTYQVTLHVTLIALLPVYLTAMVLIWANSPIDRRFLFWGSALILECVGLIYMHIQGEQYVAILYVEKILRPTIKEIVTPSQFWCYDPFLVQLRASSSNPQFIPALWEFPIAVLGSVVALVTILVYAYQHGSVLILSGYVGWFGFILYLLLLAFLWWKSITVRNIRLQFSQNALDAGCTSEDNSREQLISDCQTSDADE